MYFKITNKQNYRNRHFLNKYEVKFVLPYNVNLYPYIRPRVYAIDM